jgi:hypothetical protein
MPKRKVKERAGQRSASFPSTAARNRLRSVGPSRGASSIEVGSGETLIAAKNGPGVS